MPVVLEEARRQKAVGGGKGRGHESKRENKESKAMVVPGPLLILAWIIFSHFMTARFDNYASEPFLCACGVSIGHNFTQVDSAFWQHQGPLIRDGLSFVILQLIVGNEDDFSFSNGHWNFKNKIIPDPTDVFEESSEDMLSPHLVRVVRVVRMLDSVRSKIKMPHFLLCILPSAY